MIFESKSAFWLIFSERSPMGNLALPLPLYIDGAAVSRFHPIKIDMSLRFLIPFISVVLIASVTFAQEKSEPTADQLVAKNIDAKGGASPLHDLQTLRRTGTTL